MMNTKKFGMELISNKISNFVLRSPKASLVLSLISTLVLGLGLVKLRSDFSITSWFDPNDPLLEKLSHFERQFGNDESVVVFVCDPHNLFQPKGISALQELTQKMWFIPEVLRVDSLSNYQLTKVDEDEIRVLPFLNPKIQYSESELLLKKEEALNHKVFPGYLISKDGQCASVYARLKPALGKENDYELITLSTRKLLAQLETTYPDLKFLLSGAPVINHGFKEVTISDTNIFMPTSVILIILVLLFKFRSIWGVILPLAIIFLSLIASLGFGAFIGTTFNNLSSVLPGILIAIGLAESLHILTTFFEALDEGHSKLEATRLSMKKNLLPTFFTCFTTFLGFVTCVSSPLSPIADLGIQAGFGALFSWYLTIFGLIPCLIIFPVKAHVVKRASLGTKRAKAYVDWLNRHAFKVFFSLSALALMGLYLGLQLEVNSDPFAYFTEKVKIKRDNDVINKHFGGLSGIEIFIESGSVDGALQPDFLHTVDTLESWIESLPYVNRSFSIIDILKEIHQTLNEGRQEEYRIAPTKEALVQELLLYSMGLPTGKSINDQITVDQSGIRVSVLWTIHESNANLEAMALIENKMKELGINGSITGRMPLYKQMNGHVVTTFSTSILRALLLVGLTMILIFKSLRLGLISMIPNITPILFGGAVLTLIDHDFDIGSSIVASVVLGIAVDDTIHLLAHFANYYRAGLSVNEALTKVLAGTGSAVIWTTIILCIGFGCFMLGDFIPNVIFGILTSTMLFVALIYDILYLPAILIIMKKFNIKIL